MSNRAALYLRQSYDRHDDGLAVSRQEDDGRALAARLGLDIVATYTDNDISASKRKVQRPGYDALCADYAAGKFDALICWDLDRLTRQPRQLEDWIDAAEEKGLRLVTTNGEADLSTDGGRMYARIKAAVARGEIERKAARQRRRYQQDAERGVRHWSARPFGYELDGSLRHEEADAIRRAFHDTLNGKTRAEIAREWNAQGLRGPKDGKLFTAPGVRAQLLSPRNAGLRTHRAPGGNKHKDGRAPEVISKGDWEPIVSEEIWRGVHAMLSSVAPLRTGGREVQSLLSGLATCGVCGQKLSGGRRNRHGEQTYACRRDHVSVPRQGTDLFVWHRVVTEFLPARREAWKGRTDAAPERDSITAQIAVLAAREAELGGAYAAGILTLAQVQSATVSIQQQTRELEEKLGKLVADFHPVAGLLDATGATFAYVSPQVAVYPPPGLSLEQQRAVLTELVGSIVIAPLGVKSGRRRIPYDPEKRVQLTPVDITDDGTAVA